MCHLINSDLSYCDVDGHLVFLDIAQDRYFRMDDALEMALRRFLAQEDVPPEQLDALVAKGILVAGMDPPGHARMPDIPRPTRSAIESQTAATGRAPGPATLIEVATITWSVRRKLRHRTLKAVIEDAIAYRSIRTSAHTAAAALLGGEPLDAAMRFARARRYVPIEPRCLLDSLSLLRFLSRRRLPARIVFGVTLAPFAAHCWVQAGDVVLNETLSDANAHTPIRTI
ncbi:lasso peptide biosynthesis B2 protein [Xanthomonas massiliensis]|uniref:lasso peptide biosynthesis B2 protein n=1 Tax=Xanthomonas massiliensis TaxID=1720302 RepID=UPI000826F4AC|nr:lasso peptide biosynthesis B2 protein [Xanthomonas massiliensis]